MDDTLPRNAVQRAADELVKQRAREVEHGGAEQKWWASFHRFLYVYPLVN